MRPVTSHLAATVSVRLPADGLLITLDRQRSRTEGFREPLTHASVSAHARAHLYTIKTGRH